MKVIEEERQQINNNNNRKPGDGWFPQEPYLPIVPLYFASRIYSPVRVHKVMILIGLGGEIMY